MIATKKGTPLAASICVWILGSALLSGCRTDQVLSPGIVPSPPERFDAVYYARAIHLSWELGEGWSGESFRVWGKRLSDPDYFLIADVTNCSSGLCAYTDSNVAFDVTYVYYVAALGPTGLETASDIALEVFVPQPIAPPLPGAPDAVPLDEALFLSWDDTSREAADFSFYRVYLENDDGTPTLLGETDSEGFLDTLVENGITYSYFVTAVDDQGHESGGSVAAAGTPRPDYHGEILFSFDDQPSDAGFRFQETEASSPVLPGDDPSRHLRLEADGVGWWVVPGLGVEIASESYFTTALRCGVGADQGCIDVRSAPVSGYSSAPAALAPEFSYVARVPAGPSGWRYGLIRITHLGFAQDGAIALFDWAFQLQVDNPSLVTDSG